MIKFFSFCLIFSSCGFLSALSQGTLEDYQRAYSIRNTYNFGRVNNARIIPHWIEGTNKVWFILDGENGKEYTVLDAVSLKTYRMFDHSTVARNLSEIMDYPVDKDNIELTGLRVNGKCDTIWFIHDNYRWVYPLKGSNNPSRMEPLPQRLPEPHWMVVDEEKNGGPIVSSDGKRTAFVQDNNVYVRDNITGKESQLSLDGTLGNYYSTFIEWSPDGKKLAVNKIKSAPKRFVYYVESSPGKGSQPILHKQEYAKPGDELRFKTPVIFNVETGEQLSPSTELFNCQYDLYGPFWNDDSDGIVFEYNERGHKNYRVLEMSATNGNVRSLIDESHDKYVNYTRIFRHYLKDGKRIIWSSERDNYNHLYMYCRETGVISHQITKGPWYVREVIHVDEPGEKIYFSANGMCPDEDPYFIRYYSINFDGSCLTDLTPSPGTHTAWFSPDFKYLVDSYSTVYTPPVTVLRDAKDGKVLKTIATADISKLTAAGWKAPEVFIAPGRDGKTPMWGVIYRPSNFDHGKTYPVIEYIYQGPGDQYVPKAFYPYHRYIMPLAELGFIVVMVDGMGTSFRTREFENFCYKNLVDAGLPDHIAWLKAAGERYPYMDLNRVGIYGGSAGGQESMTAVLHHPDFYKAAYSACGCHDNRMDKIWWNEQWLGYPVDSSYIEASNVANAHLLTRPLMLVVGELDDNVEPASTMQVVDALIKANKDFELVFLPGVGHTLGEEYGEHKRFDFFVKNLLRVDPPAWSELHQE